jgi:DNA primase
MISKATIDTVFETARVEVIGDFVQLKRAGSNFKGLSPFLMNVLLFMVSPAKGIWKDFSSEKGNSVAL